MLNGHSTGMDLQKVNNIFSSKKENGVVFLWETKANALLYGVSE